MEIKYLKLILVFLLTLEALLGNVFPSNKISAASALADPTCQIVKSGKKRTLTLFFPKESELNEYKLDYSDWKQYTGPVNIGGTRTVFARDTDSEGNTSYMRPCVVFGTSSLAVSGDVQATVIEVTVPTSIGFVINPDADDSFISDPFSIDSSTPAPVDIEFLGFQSEADSPKVVAGNKYTDAEWSKMGATRTSQEIALGIHTIDSTQVIWSRDEANGVGVIDSFPINRNGSTELRLDAKHGFAFKNEVLMNYKMYFRVSLTQ
jgi:hypothetical protein